MSLWPERDLRSARGRPGDAGGGGVPAAGEPGPGLGDPRCQRGQRGPDPDRAGGQEAGTDPETGAHLYRTTPYFLERMGLTALDELPEIAPFLPEMAEIEGELDLDGRRRRQR